MAVLMDEPWRWSKMEEGRTSRVGDGRAAGWARTAVAGVAMAEESMMELNSLVNYPWCTMGDWEEGGEVEN